MAALGGARRQEGRDAPSRGLRFRGVHRSCGGGRRHRHQRGPGSAPPQGTLELVSPERGSAFRFVDNPPLRKESAGDMAVLTGPVRNADGSAAGRLQAVFVATKNGNFERAFRGQVSGTLMLSGGDILLEGVADDTRDVEVLAVAGGTNAYAGARGTVAVTETRRETRFAITFMP